MMIDLNDPECDVQEIWRQYFDTKMKLETLPKLYCGDTLLKHYFSFNVKDLYYYIAPGPYNPKESDESYKLANALINIWVEAGLIKFYFYNGNGYAEYISIETR